MNRNTSEQIVADDMKGVCENVAAELKQLEGESLLLTGGGGFLGYYLIHTIRWYNEHYSAEPIRLTVFDNFSRGCPRWLDEMQSSANIAVEQRDITVPLTDRFHDFSYIIHAASIASPIYYRKHPIETMNANVEGLKNLLEFARIAKKADRPVKGLLFFSTSEIYGDPAPESIPTPETYRGNVSCTGPRACYDESKRYGETLCVAYAEQHGIPVKTARPFNNYGPGLKITDGRVIPDFASCILKGEDIVMFSDGSPKRTYCYIADAVCGYFRILLRGRNGEAYNIGVESPEISVRELAERMIEQGKSLFGYQGRIRFETSADRHYMTDNPNRRCPVIAKAKEELGYAPHVSLDDGLRKTMLWYADNNESEAA